MTRYRKTMTQAIEEGAIQMQIATLKKAYEPLRNKRISLDNANKLRKIMDKFDGDKNMLSMLYKADIPFVSGLASARLISKHNFKAQQLMQIRKEDVEKLTDEINQIREAQEKEVEDFEEDLMGDKVNEGKMSQIDQMQKDGKSAAEIAKLMKLPVQTVKDILGEQEEVHEFKKMTVTIQDMDKRKKAIADLMKQNLGVSVTGGVIKVDGKGKDLNNYAKDLMNFYGANVRAESYTIDESADEDFYNPVTEACWVGYKQVGMKNKGGKQVPNCVPEEVVKEGVGHISGFRNDKEKANVISLAKQHGLKTDDSGSKLKISGNMRKILDIQLAVQKNGLKAEEVRVSLDEQDDAVTMNKDMKKKKEELPKKDDVATSADTEKKEGSDDKEKLKAEIEKKDNEIQALKVKAETDKAKATKKETEKMVNPETGEPLLQVGIAYKHMRDKMKKEKMQEAVKFDAGKMAALAKKDGVIAKMMKTSSAKSVFNSEVLGDSEMERKYQKEDMDAQPQDKDVKKKDGTQPKKYYKSLSKDTKNKRADHFKDRDTTKNDNRPAPGDKDAKTKPSIHTKKFKQMYGEMKKDDAYAIGMAQAKKHTGDTEPPLEKSTIKKGHEIAKKILKKEEHPSKEMYEQIAGLKKKAEKSGMPYGILKKVYDRGMAAWRGGHRPGASQQQWAFARVNSFITKPSGTWGGADKDLAAKVKGK